MAAWTRAAKEASAELHWVRPNKYEVHGDMLVRLWNTEIIANEDDEHLISEIDFLPERMAVPKLMDTADKGKLKIIGAPYVTRTYADHACTDTSPGQLKSYLAPDGKTALLGPWLLYVRNRGLGTLRSDWLAPSSSFNDAGNLGIKYALEDKAITPDQFAFLSYRDAWPIAHGCQYPGVGTHFFFARELDAPADKVIGWANCKRPLTAGQHLENVAFCLTHRSGLTK